MRKLVSVSFFLIILVSIIVSFSLYNGKHNKELEESINSAFKENSVEKIDLNSLTDFDWDKAYIFPPYTPQESINEQLGINFKDPSSIDYRDDIYLIVFVNHDKVVHYAEISRENGDVSTPDDALTPSNATLKINRDVLKKAE
ncbi:hypothetical protein [Bacillus atrophaeus]|uniref:hypothetical protein n=1 Tax=Bacillus atrophaeus TaxID=1452 RepID=UPI003F5A15E7